MSILYLKLNVYVGLRLIKVDYDCYQYPIVARYSSANFNDSV